jgi:hypothetical protein
MLGVALTAISKVFEVLWDLLYLCFKLLGWTEWSASSSGKLSYWKIFSCMCVYTGEYFPVSKFAGAGS